MTSNMIQTITLPTNNRGNKDFIISQNHKGYFAHELGKTTTWGLVTGNGERKAHPINPTRRFRNQYGTYFRPIPFPSIEQATLAINEHASTWRQYA